MATKRKSTVKEPPHKGYTTRVCVPEPMPPMCPHCHGSDTIVIGGVNYNIFTKTVYRRRKCNTCSAIFNTCRPFTAEEKAQKM